MFDDPENLADPVRINRYIITLEYNSRIQKLWKSVFRDTEA